MLQFSSVTFSPLCPALFRSALLLHQVCSQADVDEPRLLRSSALTSGCVTHGAPNPPRASSFSPLGFLFFLVIGFFWGFFCRGYSYTLHIVLHPSLTFVIWGAARRCSVPILYPPRLHRILISSSAGLVYHRGFSHTHTRAAPLDPPTQYRILATQSSSLYARVAVVIRPSPSPPPRPRDLEGISIIRPLEDMALLPRGTKQAR